MIAGLDEGNVGGYSVAYGREDIYFPVYVTAALAAVFMTATWITGALYWLVLGAAAAGLTVLNNPHPEVGCSSISQVLVTVARSPPA